MSECSSWNEPYTVQQQLNAIVRSLTEQTPSIGPSNHCIRQLRVHCALLKAFRPFRLRHNHLQTIGAQPCPGHSTQANPKPCFSDL
jgi:hypothetical protein